MNVYASWVKWLLNEVWVWIINIFALSSLITLIPCCFIDYFFVFQISIMIQHCSTLFKQAVLNCMQSVLPIKTWVFILVAMTKEYCLFLGHTISLMPKHVSATWSSLWLWTEKSTGQLVFSCSIPVNYQ